MQNKERKQVVEAFLCQLSVYKWQQCLAERSQLLGVECRWTREWSMIYLQRCSLLLIPGCSIGTPHGLGHMTVAQEILKLSDQLTCSIRHWQHPYPTHYFTSIIVASVQRSSRWESIIKKKNKLSLLCDNRYSLYLRGTGKRSIWPSFEGFYFTVSANYLSRIATCIFVLFICKINFITTDLIVSLHVTRRLK